MYQSLLPIFRQLGRISALGVLLFTAFGLIVPEAHAVAAYDSETVLTWTQLGKRGFPIVCGFTPTFVKTFEPVAVTNPLGIREGQPQIVKDNSLLSKRNPDRLAQVHFVAINGHGFNM